MGRDPESPPRKSVPPPPPGGRKKQASVPRPPEPRARQITRPSVPPPPPPGSQARPSVAPPAAVEPEPAASPPREDPLEAEVQHLERELESVDPRDRRAQALLHLEILRILEEAGEPSARLVERAKKAAAACPEMSLVHRALRRQLERAGKHDGVLATLDAELTVVRDPRARAALHLHRGRVLRDVLKKTTAAEDLSRAASLDPGAAAPVEALRLHHVSLGQWEELAKMLEHAASASKEEMAVSLRREAAMIREHVLDEPVRAVALYETVLKADPDDPLAMAAVERVYGKAGKHAQLIDLLVGQAETTSLPRIRFNALMRAATLASERLGDTQRALELFGRAAEVRPGNGTPVDAMAELHRRAGDWESYASVLALRAQLSGSVAERTLMAVLRAAVLSERLGRTQEAIELLQEALESDPTDHTLNHMLRGLLASGGLLSRWVKLENVRAERIEDKARRAAAMHVIGTTCEADPDGRGLAVSAYTKALTAQPDHAPAFQALRRIYERAGQWQELAELIEKRIAVIPQGAEKRHLMRRLAAILEERLGDPEASLRVLEKLRRTTGEEPTDLVTLWDLQRLHAGADRFKEHVEALRAEASIQTDPEVRAELLWQCAVVMERRLQDIPAAVDLCEEALTILPTHRPSLDSLVRMAEECGDWAEYLSHCDRALEGLDDREKAERLVRSARFAADVVGDEEDAVARCSRALEHAPGHPLATEYLAVLYERKGDHARLVEVMEAMAAADRDPIRRARLRTRLADLIAEHLDRPADAVAAYGKALKDVPDHIPALMGLERVGLHESGWEGLVDTYRKALDGVQEPEDRPPFLRKLAVLLGLRLGKHEDARVLLMELTHMDPKDTWALRLLVLLDVRDGRWSDAADALASLAEAMGDPQVAAACRSEEACIRERRMQQDVGDLLSGALDVYHEDRSLLHLLEPRAGDPGTRAKVLTCWIDLSTDAHHRSILMGQLASELEKSGQDYWPEVLDRALGELPTNLPIVRRARRVAQQKQDWSRALDLMETEGRGDVTYRPAARIDALMAAARVAEEHLADTERARVDLESAFHVDHTHRGVVEELRRLLREQQQWRLLADVLGKHAKALPVTERPDVLLERASVLRDRLQSPGEAAITLEQLLKNTPATPEALVMLGDIYYAAGSWQKAVQAFRSAEELLDPSTGQWRHARLRRVEVMSERLGLFGEAENILNDSLKTHRGDREMLALLARVRRGARNWDGVQEVLENLIRTAEPAEAVGLWVEAARVALARNDTAQMNTCFGRAAQLSLQAPQSFHEVKTFALERSPGDMAHLLKDVLFHAPQDRQDVTGPMRLLVAELMAADRKMAAAESEVRLALTLMPDNVNAWILLARTTGNHQEAHQGLAQALRIDPFRPGIYEALSGLGEKAPAFAEPASRAAEVLTAMGAFSTGASPQTPPKGDKRLLRHHILSMVTHPDEPRPALELMAQAGLKLGSLYPQPDHGPLEPVPRGNEVSLLVGSVARIFGVEKYNLFYTSKSDVTTTLIADERPSLIIGESLLSAPEALLRFHLGRMFTLLATDSVLASILSPEQTQALTDALVGQVFQNVGDQVLVQRVSKVLGWMGRRAITNAARDLAKAPPDLSGWQHATNLSAVRGGLLACADVATARSALHAMAGIPLPAPGAEDTWEVSRSVPCLGEVLAYAVSSEYAQARSAVA